MGCTHLSAYRILQSSGKIKVTAIADTNENARKFAKELGAQLFPDGDSLINEGDINTVDICLPTYLHFPFAEKTVKKGYNLFVEKPLCRTVEEADKLVALADEKGIIAMTGQCIRFWDEYIFLKETLESGKYSKLKNAYFRRLSPRPTWSWQNWLLDNAKSGGAALDLHIHDSDFLLYLFGQPKEIKSILNKSGEKDGYILTACDYGDFTVIAEGTWDMPSSFPFEMYYRAVFEKGVVEYSSARGLKIYADGDAFVPEIKKQCGESSEAGGNVSDLAGYYNELSYFIDCIHENKKPQKSTLKDGRDSVAFVTRELKNRI